PRDCRIYMLMTHDWKYIHAPGFAPVLFDRKEDPDELNDLGLSPEHEDIRRDLASHLMDWALNYRQRETYSDTMAERFTAFEEKAGVLIGYWNEDDLVDPANAPRQLDG
ncbi:MAG: phosphonate monoester hydrolase, partial [Pseudomonadota bacterium]